MPKVRHSVDAASFEGNIQSMQDSMTNSLLNNGTENQLLTRENGHTPIENSHRHIDEESSMDDEESFDYKMRQLEGLEREMTELINHMKNMLAVDKTFIQNNTKQALRLINGMDVEVFEQCPCTTVQDEVFHSYFRKIDWSESNLKYLNKVQDRWSIYCQH